MLPVFAQHEIAFLEDNKKDYERDAEGNLRTDRNNQSRVNAIGAVIGEWERVLKNPSPNAFSTVPDAVAGWLSNYWQGTRERYLWQYTCNMCLKRKRLPVEVRNVIATHLDDKIFLPQGIEFDPMQFSFTSEELAFFQSFWDRE